MNELAAWDAVETARRIRSRDVSLREVIDAAIARAEAASSLGAVVTDSFESARRATPTGPLAGVPTFIKDLVQVAGVRTTWGSRATGEYVSLRTDPSLERLFATGLVSLGKSATPEFGLTATTEALRGPPCRNPWDPSRSVGGSSGGAASLVAAGVVPIAHASDGGGSIRIPAACNGLVGLKPTRRRFDMDASHLLPVNVAVQGVVTRSVRDTIAFFDALEQRRGSIPPIGDVPPKSPRPLRIGVFVDSAIGTPVDADHRAATTRAGKLCESLGHRVEAIACPFEAQVLRDFLRFWGSLGFVYLYGGKLFTHRGFDRALLEPWTRDISRYFTSELGSSLRATRRLRRFTRTYAEVMQRYDVLVCPTTGTPPPRLGHLAPDVPFEVAFDRLLEFVPFTPFANAAGAPAISLPLGRGATGLPIGVQLSAAMGAERVLLALSLELEAAAPWNAIAPTDRWQSTLAPPRDSRER